MPPTDEIRRLSITEKTLIPAGIVVAIAGTFVAATWWLRGQLASIDAKLVSIDTQIESVREQMVDRAIGAMNRYEFDVWVKMLRQVNPTSIVVPEPVR